MKRLSKSVAVVIVVVCVILLSSCRWVLSMLPDEDRITPIVGNYYTAAMGNTGTALHWHPDDGHYGNKPLLEAVYNTQICGNYIVARAGVDFYLLYPIQVQSLQEANEKRVGPVDKKELMSVLLRVAGDTILHQAGPFK